MKNTLAIAILVMFTACVAQAQRGEVRRAERSLNRGELEAAKTHIELAIQDPSTAAEAKTWLLKAQIFMQIAMSEDPEVRSLADAPLNIADEAAKKAEGVGLSNLEIIQFQQMRIVMSELMYNEGVEAYTRDDFRGASQWFLRSYLLNEEFGAADTTTLYNAGLSAELGQDYPEARRIYNQLLDMDFEQPYLYTSLASIHMAEGDTAKALDYVMQGREQYPDDLNIIFNEANIYIFTGDTERAKDVLALAIEKDPENPGLYFALAANLDKMAQDTTYSLNDRQSFHLEAENYYKQAIEKDSEYFDAIYNLGVLYFNEGIRMYDLADEALRKAQNFNQWTKDEQEILTMWSKAEPYFEKARTLIEEDDIYYETVIISLIQLYARTNKPEKLKEVENIYLERFAREEEEY